MCERSPLKVGQLGTTEPQGTRQTAVQHRRQLYFISVTFTHGGTKEEVAMQGRVFEFRKTHTEYEQNRPFFELPEDKLIKHRCLVLTTDYSSGVHGHKA